MKRSLKSKCGRGSGCAFWFGAHRKIKTLPEKPAERLIFANQLRGLAALCVAASHLIGVYWAMRGYIAAATFSPIVPGPFPWLFKAIDYEWFELGPFGVALFFLISGLVIPFSLQKHSQRTFLLARALRIYPTLIIALAMEMSLLYAAARYWHLPFSISNRTIIMNALLITDVTGYPVVDFVNWTLSIEIKFYLLAALIARSIRNGTLSALFIIACPIVLIDLLLFHYGTYASALPPIINSVSLDSPYLIFMLIGVLFNFHDRSLLTMVRLVMSVVAMTMFFVVSWRLGVQHASYPIVTINYLLAIFVFSICYAAKSFFHANLFLDFMASISFPFYLIHAVFGFTIMKFLMLRWGWQYYTSLGIAFTLIVGLSYLLHRTVELWTINIGRNLASRKMR